MDYQNLDHCLEEAAAGFFFTSAMAVSTADPGFMFLLGGFSRFTVPTVSMVALASFLVESAPDEFLKMEGASEKGLLEVLLDPDRNIEPKGMDGTERVLDASEHTKEPGGVAISVTDDREFDALQ